MLSSQIRLHSMFAASAISLLAACGVAETTSAQRFTETGELVALSGGDAGAANACFTCHGMEGRGNGAGAPRLAGLDIGYLDRQLNAYASGRRQHPEMEWIAGRLSPAHRHAVSAYYAAMPYQPLGRGKLPEAGAELYLRGDTARRLPSCASCHGVAGQGLGPANPALGGQPAAYLAEQIAAWRHSKRRTDPYNVMLRISQQLTPAEIDAVSAYAAALPGDFPGPAPRATFPEARRDDPRNDASAPLQRGPVSE